MPYSGSIELISGIKPKNNGSFPLVDAKDVRVDDNTRLDVALQTISGGGTILAVDDTLSVAGQAADAKAAGDRLTELEGRVSAGDLIAAVKVYWGTGTEAAINGSGSTPVQANFAHYELTRRTEITFTVTAGAQQYIWFAVPAAFEQCEFVVGGIHGGFVTAGTNGAGTYNVFRSARAGLGETSVTAIYGTPAQGVGTDPVTATVQEVGSYLGF